MEDVENIQHNTIIYDENDQNAQREKEASPRPPIPPSTMSPWSALRGSKINIFL